MTSFDAGRGCPFQCSFCTIINVQGRKSRRRSPDDIEQLIRAELCAQGISRFFITDDNFARNKDWEAIFDRLIQLRERRQACDIQLIIQVDTLCHKIPNFIDKCDARRRDARVHRAREHQSRQSRWPPRSGRTRSPNIARCCWPGSTPASSPMPVTSSAFPSDTPESIRRGHRDHQEGTADRYPGVLLPHAAARIGRPQDAVATKGRGWTRT